MNVNVKLGAGLGAGGCKEASLDVSDGAAVHDVLRALLTGGLLATGVANAELAPGEVPVNLSVFLNGVNVRYLDGGATPVAEGDTVHFVTLLAGG